MAFCNPCTRSTDSSSLFKSLLRRKIFKKSSIHRPIIQKLSTNGRRFQRVKGTNFVQEVILPSKNPPKESVNNYDMTVYEYDHINDTQIALSRNGLKNIPRWARKSQLQLEIINQVYYDKNPEEIFGSIDINSAREIIDSMKIKERDFSCYDPFCYLSPNFV